MSQNNPFRINDSDFLYVISLVIFAVALVCVLIVLNNTTLRFNDIEARLDSIESNMTHKLIINDSIEIISDQATITKNPGK